MNCIRVLLFYMHNIIYIAKLKYSSSILDSYFTVFFGIYIRKFKSHYIALFHMINDKLGFVLNAEKDYGLRKNV